MYEFGPITPRVQKIRERYRSTIPFIDTTRYRIVTDFYKTHRYVRGTLKRAMNFKNLCEQIPIFVREDDLLVGDYTETYKASALYPEYSIRWIVPELEDNSLRTRESDPYQYTEEDRQYIL
ncbi:MAG: pyruvate formate lyase family protein, partial [Coriobacteriales bacterium]